MSTDAAFGCSIPNQTKDLVLYIIADVINEIKDDSTSIFSQDPVE